VELAVRRSAGAYVGYKGGSEPGVVSTTWLLYSRSGKRNAMSAGWNNSQADVDQQRFFNLMENAAELIEGGGRTGGS
jgi:hypothetical protein